MKFCNKCNKETDRKPNGDCRLCANARNKRYYENNKIKINEREAEYRAKNPEAIKVARDKYKANNKEKLAAKQAKYVKANRLARNEYNKKYKAERKEKYRIEKSEWYTKNSAKAAIKYIENKEKIKSYQSTYAKTPNGIVSTKASQANRRARKLNADGKHTKYEIKELYIKQRGKCACCRDNISDSYHADHIIALAVGGSNDIYNIQLLCQVCNQQKGVKNPIDFMQSKGFLL